ncbi:MAG: DNA methylase, partial [Candidatus Paceibacterota bacterium]
MIIKGRGTARELGINVVNRSEKTLFHWFMCVILFSKPVQQEIAGNAFLLLKQYGYDTPDYILKAKWKEIVNTLGKAHYVRHDESTATRLLEASKLLVGQYDGCIK